MPRPTGWHALSVAIGLLWGASLALPVARIDHDFERGYWLAGADLLGMGWAGPLMLQLGWFANLALVPALLALAGFRPRSSAWMKGLGWALLLLFINTLFWRSVPDSAGRHAILQYGPGYFSWMAAIALAGAALLLKEKRLREFDET